MNYECNNTDLIHQIVLDPNLGEHTSAMLKKVFVGEYGFMSFKGKVKDTSRVLQSQLYTKQSVGGGTAYRLMPAVCFHNLLTDKRRELIVFCQ